jgi:hypothetical protein
MWLFISAAVTGLVISCRLQLSVKTIEAAIKKQKFSVLIINAVFQK